jgi:hypothetical protein
VLVQGKLSAQPKFRLPRPGVRGGYGVFFGSGQHDLAAQAGLR